MRTLRDAAHVRGAYSVSVSEGEAIVPSLINKALERAQKKVEQPAFRVRKNLLKYGRRE